MLVHTRQRADIAIMAFKMLQPLLVLVVVSVTSVLGQRNVGLSGPEFRNLQLGQNPDLLEFAAMTGERVLIVIDGPETRAAVQEDVNANIWCLPWLQRFPGAEAVWRFLRYNEDFTMREQELVDGQFPLLTPDIRRMIGGEFNEWLNITRTVLVSGAEGTDTGGYQCQACFFRGTPFEECHTANLTLQVIGGPPDIDEGQPDEGPIEETLTRRTYRVGTNFCIPPDYGGEILILCNILDGNVTAGRSQAFPRPDRAWFQDGDLLYRQPETAGAPNLRDPVHMDFFVDRMTLFPDVFIPSVLTALDDGSISLNLALQNTTMQPTPPELEPQARMEVLGIWRCEANNTFGTDVAESTLRTCGAAPMLPGCPVMMPVFAQAGDTINVGCIVCIREGAIITLDCTGSSETDVTYEWVNSENETVSTNPTFTTGVADTYSCTASNIDNPSESGVTVLAFSDAISFNGEVTERMMSAPRMDNGCSRLSPVTLPGVNSTGPGLDDITMLDFCVFINERLDLRCVTDDEDMEELEIESPGGMLGNGTLSVNVMDINAAGDYTCRLSTIVGPCSGAESTLSVDVFEPAMITRTSVPAGCTFGAGAHTGPVVPPDDQPVTLCCPVTGIEDPVQAWYRIDIDDTGCAQETFIQQGGVGGNNELTVQVTGDVTYVCRTRNRAGQDADVVSIITDSPMSMWTMGEFSACDMDCRDGVRTRDVVCRSILNNMVVPVTECDPQTRPSSEESCDDQFPDECLLDPVWISGEWSRCSRNCGGWRYRNVLCQVPMTGEIMSPGECSQQPRPSPFDFVGCNMQCCSRDRYPSRCRALGSGYCSSESFAKECCWTCGRKTIGIRY